MKSSAPRPLLLHSAAQLLTLAGRAIPRRGSALAELGIIREGAVLTHRGQILRIGTTRQLAREARSLKARAIDCGGRVVMPGFVDSHTHPNPFGGGLGGMNAFGGGFGGMNSFGGGFGGMNSFGGGFGGMNPFSMGFDSMN